MVAAPEVNQQLEPRDEQQAEQITPYQAAILQQLNQIQNEQMQYNFPADIAMLRNQFPGPGGPPDIPFADLLTLERLSHVVFGDHNYIPPVQNPTAIQLNKPMYTRLEICRLLEQQGRPLTYSVNCARCQAEKRATEDPTRAGVFICSGCSTRYYV